MVPNRVCCRYTDSIMADVEASRDDLILNAILRLGGRVLLIDVVVTPASPLPLRRRHSKTDCSVHPGHKRSLRLNAAFVLSARCGDSE